MVHQDQDGSTEVEEKQRNVKDFQATQEDFMIPFDLQLGHSSAKPYLEEALLQSPGRTLMARRPIPR